MRHLALAILLATLTSTALAAPGTSLKPFVGRDLRAMPEDEKQQFETTLKSTTGSSLSGLGWGKPWHLWEQGDDDGFVLFCGHRLILIPGASAATLWILDADGAMVTNSQFTTMYRGDITEAGYREMPHASGKLMRIRTTPMRSDIHHDLFVAIEDGRPALVRIEDHEGKLVRNQYYAPNFTVGPPVPKRSADDWAQLLEQGSVNEILEALVWLCGEHLDPSRRRKDVYQEDEESVQLFRTTRARDDVRATIRQLTQSTNRWVAEAAKQALAN